MRPYYRFQTNSRIRPAARVPSGAVRMLLQQLVFPVKSQMIERHIGALIWGSDETMTAFNEEVSSADRIGLHLSEIGRIQNNAGAILQFMAVIFAICVYFYNALVYPPNAPHKELYGMMLGVDGLFIVATCFLYFRCLTLSVGWMSYKNPKTGFHFLSTLSEEDIEKTLLKIVRSFRRGTYFFFFCFFTTALLIALVAFGYSNMLPA